MMAAGDQGLQRPLFFLLVKEDLEFPLSQHSLLAAASRPSKGSPAFDI
jgi:hypothetical protein